MTVFFSIFESMLNYMTVLLFGSTGELITEKSGNLNLGTPGIMCMGGVSGLLGAFIYTEMMNAYSWTYNPYIAVFITLLMCLLGSLFTTAIYAFFTITLKANQNVAGLALTTFGTGLSNFIGGCINKAAGSGDSLASYPQFCETFKVKLPFADNFGVFGKLFLSASFMTYIAIIIAVIASIIIKRTRIGLNLRAVGENPATADAAGVNVTKYKYIATCLGGMISGLGGIFFIMQFDGGWSQGAILPFGWLSVAIVIFVMWKPLLGIFGSAIFGALYSIKDLSVLSDTTKLLSSMIPYVVTIFVLVICSMRKKRDTQPPDSLGLSYFREDR